jgi:Flp pilus assembly protein TadG
MRAGATAVEFAITLPIFLVFLMGSFEFGWLNVLRHTADNAAYESARNAMVPGATSGEAINTATTLLNIVRTRGAKINISPAAITPETDEVTVTIDVPLAQNAIIVPRFTSNGTIHSSCTLRTERSKTRTP